MNWLDSVIAAVSPEAAYRREAWRAALEELRSYDAAILILFRYTRGGLVPFKLQCMEVDELDVSQSAPMHRGNKIVGGIEYNQYRRPVGYWFRQYDLEGYQAMAPMFPF